MCDKEQKAGCAVWVCRQRWPFEVKGLEHYNIQRTSPLNNKVLPAREISKRSRLIRSMLSDELLDSRWRRSRCAEPRSYYEAEAHCSDERIANRELGR